MLNEAMQRLDFTEKLPWQSALWVEPQKDRWEQTLESFTRELLTEGRLAVVLLLPLAKRLPERHGWQDLPAGFQRGGIDRLSDGLI